MRQSQYFLPTLKEDPADAELVSHRLMLRAGLIRQVASGLYNWLPLGLRVVRKIEAIARQELDAIGAQEISMPVVHPAELWRESGRWDKMGPELLRLRDRHERDFCLGPTHEEIVTDLFRREVRSYRQLPCNLYQIQTKFRDEIRPRFGVIRAREFSMKDGYSFHEDQASFDQTYQAMHGCYSRILSRLQLDFRAVEADSGAIGGAHSHEFHALAQSGEDLIAHATKGSYAASLERAAAAPPPPAPPPSEALDEVATPGCASIAQVAELLDVPPMRCLKTLVVRGEQSLVALALRGDHELNLVKAGKLPGVRSPLQFAEEDEIRAAVGAGPGAIGPLGIKLPLYVDRDARSLADFVCGANRDGYHWRGANWGRDLPVANAQVHDIRQVAEGDPAPDGQGELRFLRGIEVGHLFQLGALYSEAMQATFLDREGRDRAPLMGCYGMGITRLVAAIIEQHHDQRGILWPPPVAPFDLHIVALNYAGSEAVRQASEQLLAQCRAAGLEALLDDRDERPGVKFADADLIGLPRRLTLGERSLGRGQVEYRPGQGAQTLDLALDEAAAALRGQTDGQEADSPA